MNILLSAYACEPHRGSEPAVGWNIALQVARQHDVWVLTRSSNRTAIESELEKRPQPRIRWEYIDPPRSVTFWKKGTRGLLPFYYFWQILAYRKARELGARIVFDLIHHVTLTQYWTPSYLALLKVPFVWGPVGGADRTPARLMKALTWHGQLAEHRRRLAQRACCGDPFLRMTAKNTSLALATTQATASRLETLGCSRVEHFDCVGLSDAKLHALAELPIRTNCPLRLISAGRLIDWKGFHLGIAAFARVHMNLPNSEYWMIGDGADRRTLSHLAQTLGVGHKVKFFGDRPHSEVFAFLSDCDVLIHPSFHDAGAMVCNEAMAAGRPVVCLDLGGPALQVSGESGIKIAPGNPELVVEKLASAITWLSANPGVRKQMGMAARQSARRHAWTVKGHLLASWYEQIARVAPRPNADLGFQVF